MEYIENDRIIPIEESSKCKYCFRHTFTAANRNNPFLYYPLYAGHYIALEDYCIKRQGFASLLVIYTESGEAAFSVDDGPLLTMRSGTAMVVDTRRYHIYYPTKTPWSFYYLHATGHDCLSFANALAHPERPVYTYSDANRAKIKEILEKVLSAPNEISVPFDLQMSVLVYQLLMVLSDTSDIYTDISESDTFARLRPIEHYMREHLTEPISTETLAKQLYMSRSYFSILFRQTYGIPPHQYLTALRIDYAKQLLIGTDLPISEIAAKSGYTDIPAFSRCFFRLAGMTPSQFRGIK